VRIAVTGSTGFIGLHLVRALPERGDEVVPIARSSSDAAQLGDLARTTVRVGLDEEEALADAFRGCDAIVHLAGGGFADERATWQANAEGTRHVVAACRRAGVPRLLLASTVTVTRKRVAAYGASKREAEEEALASGLDVTVFRFAFVYGPGRTGVFARLVELARRLPVVPVVGAGKLDIAPVYVDDVVEAIVTALHQPDIAAGKVYTLAGPAATFDDVVDGVLERLRLRKRKLHVPGPVALMLARVLSRLSDPPLTRDNVLGMTQEADHDSSLARSELGFSPRPLDVGLDAAFSAATDGP
jgi:nucleoside-diphosphate-sugar epimerase